MSARETVVNSIVKITRAQLEKLNKGEPIIVHGGSTNIMGNPLGTEIRPPGSPRRKPAQEKLDAWLRSQRRKTA